MIAGGHSFAGAIAADLVALRAAVRQRLVEAARSCIAGGVALGIAVALCPYEVPGAVVEAVRDLMRAGRRGHWI